MARRLALLLVCLASLAPALWRLAHAGPEPGRDCPPEGRGAQPRTWVGCSADPGPPRDLSGRERLALGLQVDLNRATAADLELVPGLSAGLAAAVVASRAAAGPFAGVEDLLRVRGIGPARLARARPHLRVEPEERSP